MILNKHNLKCFQDHFGHWMMDEQRFQQLYNAIMAENIVFGDLKSDAEPVGLNALHELAAESDADLVTMTASGVMIVPIEGAIMRGASSFGGTSSVQIRRIMRNAVNDSKIKGIMLKIDSPGGTVAGTDELAEDIKATAAKIPVHAHVDGLMASAAFWTGAQASHITATRTSEVGSLGTVAVVHDMSEMAKNEGVKVHVISTGPHKGAFTPGSEVTKEQLADLQGIVDKLNGFFKEAVMDARGFTQKETDALFDGRVHVAEDALKMGLIDGVAGFDEAMRGIESAAQAASGSDDDAMNEALATRRRRR